MLSPLKASKMEAIIKVPIQFDKGLVPIQLPEKLILYAADTAHIVLATEPIIELEEKAPFKEGIGVTLAENRHLIELPMKVYEFYHLDEADYTMMVSEINPRTIEILL